MFRDEKRIGNQEYLVRMFWTFQVLCLNIFVILPSLGIPLLAQRHRALVILVPAS